jgi:hypothetical protein
MTGTATKSGTRPRIRQWAWFIGLWLAGFFTLGAISLVIRAIMNIG